MKRCIFYSLMVMSVFYSEKTAAQNALYIPPVLTGTDFQLNVKSGTQTFFNGYQTPTYGINMPFMAPTLFFNKGDSVSLHVTNNLTIETTMHWHGLHVPSKYDGGPHQIIEPGQTWDATYKVMNDASTYWYHPHGLGKTDLQISKGLAGLIIVKDSNETSLNLPRTYGVDDFPLIVQSKAFDVLYQIAIATELDTVVMVNGTKNPYLDAPAQMVRFRILNGSSMRSYDFGFSNNIPFYQISSDGGLLSSPIPLTRVLLAPAERAEIVVDFGMLQGQTVYFKNYGSELPDGIFGAAKVGNDTVSIPEYNLNPLNGADYNILQINIGAPTADPVTSIPASLATVTPLSETDATLTRNFIFAPQDTTDIQQMVEGPFTINGAQFSMDTINFTTYKNTTEIWELDNQSLLAHAIHVHDVQFNILDRNGTPLFDNEMGKKDVVLVMPMEIVRVIMKFQDFTDDLIPYMYHCHMLHHEDDGMMISFLVRDSATVGIDEVKANTLNLFPNPATKYVDINLPEEMSNYKLKIFNDLGNEMNVSSERIQNNIRLDISSLSNGMYLVQVNYDAMLLTKKLLKQ